MTVANNNYLTDLGKGYYDLLNMDEFTIYIQSARSQSNKFNSQEQGQSYSCAWHDPNEWIQGTFDCRNFKISIILR